VRGVGQFGMGVRKNFFSEGGVSYWNRLSREVVIPLYSVLLNTVFSFGPLTTRRTLEHTYRGNQAGEGSGAHVL